MGAPDRLHACCNFQSTLDAPGAGLVLCCGAAVGVHAGRRGALHVCADGDSPPLGAALVNAAAECSKPSVVRVYVCVHVRVSFLVFDCTLIAQVGGMHGAYAGNRAEHVGVLIQIRRGRHQTCKGRP